MAKLKWFCFDVALKLALYSYKKKKKSQKAVTIQCVLPARPNEDGWCHWSVLENLLAKNELVVKTCGGQTAPQRPMSAHEP